VSARFATSAFAPAYFSFIGSMLFSAS
jgi:hypothetical protein